MFKQGNDLLLAISDASIVGKTFGKELKLTVSKEFYSERFCGEEEVIKLIRTATIVNAIGKEIIAVMLEKNFITEENVLYISNIPHAQVVII